MTPHVLKLDFDAGIFGFPCGRFELGDVPVSSDEIDRLLAQAARWDLRHVVVRVPAEWRGACAMLAARGFRFVHTSVGLETDLGTPPAGTSLPTTNTDIEVRSYQREDDIRLVEITVGAFQSGTRFHAEPLFARESIDQLHTAWIRNLIADESVSIFTARCEGEIAGYMTVSRGPDASRGHIGLFAVDPANQGRGIGRALLLAAESAVREPSQAVTGLQAMTVMTEESNANALHLYKHSGYTVRRRWTVMQAAFD